MVRQGAYICGEETSLLNALEGHRPEARSRSSQISKRGPFDAPTLIHNVGALCTIPRIVTHGAIAHTALGSFNSRGTKLLSLNSLFCRSGLYEIEFSTSLVGAVEWLGRGSCRGKLSSLIVDGSLVGIVPPVSLDARFGYKEMQAIDYAVGYGGVIASADNVSIPRIVIQVLRFDARKSCDKYTPCHLSTPTLTAMADVVVNRLPVGADRFRQLIDTLATTSLCEHGRGLAEFVQSARRHYLSKLQAWCN